MLLGLTVLVQPDRFLFCTLQEPCFGQRRVRETRPRQVVPAYSLAVYDRFLGCVHQFEVEDGTDLLFKTRWSPTAFCGHDSDAYKTRVYSCLREWFLSHFSHKLNVEIDDVDELRCWHSCA
jgi:hypothetical protein